jgi:hypothetical protein
MSQDIGSDDTADEPLQHEVSDQALEAAAAQSARAFTVAMCTGNLECPF